MQDILRACPACKRTDRTSFSKCRYCGTRYDATIAKAVSFDQKFVVGVCIGAVALGVGYEAFSIVKGMRAKQLAPIAEQVRRSHRPLVIEFYADWCGPCRAYGPIIEECRSRYGSRIDFRRLNVDDPANRETAQMLGVSSIPKTCFFDRNGDQIGEAVGGLSSEELDKYMTKLLR